MKADAMAPSDRVYSLDVGSHKSIEAFDDVDKFDKDKKNGDG